MRITDVPVIVQNLQVLLVGGAADSRAANMVEKVLLTLSKYVNWIDIDLIISNTELFNLLLNFLKITEKREPTCKVFTAMLNKGMLPETKLQFIKQLYPTLENTFSPFINNIENLEEEDVNFVVNIAELHSAVLTSLAGCFTANAILPEVLAVMDDTFVPLAIKLLLNEWNDIGENIIPGLKAYIELGKSRKNQSLQSLQNGGSSSPIPSNIINNLLQAIIRKMRYDDDYDFDELDDDEETDLGLFMRDLKTIYENIGTLNSEILLSDLSNKIAQIPELEGNDLELVLRLIGQLAEAIPSVIDVTAKNATNENNQYGPAYLIDIITKIIDLDIVKPSSHVGVHCEYYSVLIRYERLLLCNDKELVIRILPKILTTLLDERGILHKKSVQARKYCCVAFSRIIRTSLSNSATLTFLTENNAGEQILAAVCQAITDETFFDNDDRLNLFEVAGLAASRITSNPENWCQTLVKPCLNQFQEKVSNASSGSGRNVTSYVDEQLTLANHYISCIIRTSKAFTAKFSMENKNCQHIFLESLTVFLETFRLDEKIQSVIRPNIKQFIHKMVLCLNKHIDTVIVPALLESFTICIDNDNISGKMLIDIVPILAQIIQKHTKDVKVHNFCWPTLARVCFQIWEKGSTINDEEILSDCKYIRRHCYNIIMIAIQNKEWLNEISTNVQRQDFDVKHFLSFLLEGVSTSQYCDAQTIRNSILALNHLAKEWLNKSNEILEFFVVTCCPVIMMFPVHPDSRNFALQDPQLGLAIKELAGFVKFLYKSVGADFLSFMASEVLKGKMGLSDSEVQHFCEAVEQRENKQWTQYVRNFYGPRMMR